MRGERKAIGLKARMLEWLRAATGAGLGLALIISLAMSLGLNLAECRLSLDGAPLPARLEQV
ncbi:MAG: hypothetical protein ACT6RD_07610 [Brevundimonas sp.]|uniref:hypothetical protein n=1 Tax=Brevundimonas sp. TaxID=1871086 RepID=UPI0040349D1F